MMNTGIISTASALLLIVATLTSVNAQSQLGFRACEDEKDKMMSYTVTGGDINDDPSNHLLCECRETENPGEYMLLCSLYDNWQWCTTPTDGSEQACASVLFGQVFSDTGEVTDRFRNYDYVGDRQGTIVVERYPETKSCRVTANSVTCNSCEILDTCPPNTELNSRLYEMGLPSSEELGIFTDIKVNCTNVNPGAVFECGIADGAGQLLDILNGVPVLNEDGTTRPPQTIDPALFPPTVTPVAASSSGVPSVEPTELAGEPSVTPTESMIPTVSMAPTVSAGPSMAPTITAEPTLTPEPTDLPTVATEAPVEIAAQTTSGAGALAVFSATLSAVVAVSSSLFLLLL